MFAPNCRAFAIAVTVALTCVPAALAGAQTLTKSAVIIEKGRRRKLVAGGEASVTSLSTCAGHRCKSSARRRPAADDPSAASGEGPREASLLQPQ